MQNHMQPMFYGFQRFSMLQPDSIRGLSKEVVEEVKDRSVLLREACQRCVIAHAAQCLLSILCWWRKRHRPSLWNCKEIDATKDAYCKTRKWSNEDCYLYPSNKIKVGQHPTPKVQVRNPHFPPYLKWAAYVLFIYYIYIYLFIYLFIQNHRYQALKKIQFDGPTCFTNNL